MTRLGWGTLATLAVAGVAGCSSTGVAPIEPAPSVVRSAPIVKPTPRSESLSRTCAVTSVSDGDTFRCRFANGVIVPVRVIGIDTPETKDPRKPVQCYGPEASRRAKVRLSDETVTLTNDPTQDATDRYQRTLAYVTVDGIDYGNFMIREGFARVYIYRKSAPPQRAGIYQRTQRLAQARHAGLWGACHVG